MGKINAYLSAKAVGYVTNFKIRTSDRSDAKWADVGIKDELTNNIIFGTIFENENMKYDDKPVTLGGLKKIFLDSEDKPRHVLVRALGKTYENKYTNKNGQEVTNTKTIFFSITSCDDSDEQGIVFIIRGIVEAIKEQKDGEELKLRVGIVSYDKDENPTGIDYNVLVAGGDIKDKLEEKDIEKYSQINVAGDILNINPRDKYGSTGEIVKEMRIQRVYGVTSSDDLEDFEDVYVALKSGKKPKVSKKSKDDDEDTTPKKSSKKYDDDFDKELEELD